jgi:Family of unknown function (DUF5329)
VTTHPATLCSAITITLISLGFASFAAAATPTTAQAEVEYLLGAVANSRCDFNRNGEWYDSQKASAHLRAKYNALVALGHFVTAMDFIEGVATKSSLSGRAYFIRCAGAAPVPTDQWLRQALAQYRRCASSANACASWLRQDAQGIDQSASNRPVSRLSGP